MGAQVTQEQRPARPGQARASGFLQGASIALCALAGLALLVDAGAMVLVVPQFVEMFADYEIQLPGLTALILNVSPVVGPAVAAGLIAILIAKELLVRKVPAVTLVVNAIFLLLGLAWGAVMALGLFLPMVYLMQDMA